MPATVRSFTSGPLIEGGARTHIRESKRARCIASANRADPRQRCPSHTGGRLAQSSLRGGRLRHVRNAHCESVAGHGRWPIDRAKQLSATSGVGDHRKRIRPVTASILQSAPTPTTTEASDATPAKKIPNHPQGNIEKRRTKGIHSPLHGPWKVGARNPVRARHGAWPTCQPGPRYSPLSPSVRVLRAHLACLLSAAGPTPPTGDEASSDIALQIARADPGTIKNNAHLPRASRG